MIADSYQQWSCIECVIKKQEYEANLSKLEQRFLVYKEKLILTHELIKEYGTKCKENENLQKQLKQVNAVLKEYQSKLINSVTKQIPLEEELEKLKKIKVDLEKKRESEVNKFAATEKHNIQLSGLVQQLKDEIAKHEAEIELGKETATNLTHSLKEAKGEKLSVDKKRLKTLRNVVSFADFVQKEGRLSTAHKKMLARWRSELSCLVNGKGDFSEEEEGEEGGGGIFSPGMASSCSSRDTGLGSVSDDDHSSVISVNLESLTSRIKEQSGEVSSDVTCKPQASDYTKKVARRKKNKKLSPGIAVPVSLGSGTEVMLGSNGIQVHGFPKAAPLLGTELAKRNSSVEEVPTKKGSDIEHVESNDGTVTADPGTGMKSDSLPSLFDPDVPLTLSGAEVKEETSTERAMTNFSSVSVVDESDLRSAFPNVESPAESICIQNIMEEMGNVPNLLSPWNSEPGMGRSHCHTASMKEGEMRDAHTLSCVETADAAVGTDTAVEPSCHVAVQTCGSAGCTIACQTIFTAVTTAAVQTDDMTMLHTANSVSHPEGKSDNSELSEKKGTRSTGKYENSETDLSRRAIQTHCVTDSPLPRPGSVKMLNASTATCVEMLDVAGPSCTVAVTGCRIAPQTGITDYGTSVAQVDDAADCISYPEGTLEAKSTCSGGRKLCRSITTDAAVEMQCLSDGAVRNNSNLNSCGALTEHAENERLFSGTSKQNCVESRANDHSTMIRCDYENPEKCLREELKKWQSLVAWLCSNSSDVESPLRSFDSSIPAPTLQSRTNKLLTQQSTQTTDELLMNEVMPASSGLFAVEGTPYSSCCCKGMHPDDWLMPVVPCFQHHMGSLLFRPKPRNCKLPSPSTAMPSETCCHETVAIGACPSMKHCCHSLTAHTHQEQKNCCCCLCVKRNHSNRKSHGSENLMHLSYMRSSSNKKSVKQVRKRIMDTEDSSDGWETGENHEMPSRNIFHKRPRINSTSSTESDSEIEDTGLWRRGICAEKQDSCLGTRSGRKMTRKQLRERRKVVHASDRCCQTDMDNGKKYRTAGTRLEENLLKADTQHHASSCARFRKRKNEDHERDRRKCISEQMLGKNFSLPKLKHRSKHITCGQVNEHTKSSDTSVKTVCSELHIDQSDTDSVKSCEAASRSTKIPTYLQSNALQRTEAVMGEDKHKRLSCVELFGSMSDVSLDEEQESGRIAAQMQTVQPGKASNKRKRRAQVESRRAGFEMHDAKRTKIGTVNKENSDSVTSKDHETVSNISLNSVSESNPEKCGTKTCNAPTGISLASGEQTHLDEDCNISTGNGSCLILEHKTGQAVGKADVSLGVGPRKLSKLEKLRRNLIRAKMPSKIAINLPVKRIESRKKLTARCEASSVGSESSRPGVKNIAAIAREDGTPNSVSTTRQLRHKIPAPILENENTPTRHDTTTHNTANWLDNNHDNPVDNRLFTCDSVTGQICSSTFVTKEQDNETNHAVDLSKSFASTDNVSDAEIRCHSQDTLPISTYVTETVSHVSVSKNQENSSSTDRVPETFVLPISYKENMPETSKISENVGHVTLPNTCIEGSSGLETVTEGRSQNMSSETCHAAVDFKGAKSPGTVPNISELEDIICPNFCQESLPCPISPIEDPVMSEPEQLISTQDTVQAVGGLSIDPPEKLTPSSMHKQITVTKKRDEKLFAGCVLQWVLKDYEAQHKKKNLKKPKSMMTQLKEREDRLANKMKQEEKAISQKELKELLSSRFTNEKFNGVVQKFSSLNSEFAPLILAKMVVKLVSDDIKAQVDYSKKHNIPPLTSTQQRLVTLVFTLQSQHEQYKDLLEAILLGIEYRLFRLGHAPDIARACSLARFYASLCLLQRDKQRVLAFCYDAMYCLYYKAFPLLFTVYTTYPDVLPHARVGKDILLIMTMSCLILMQRTEETQPDYKIEALKNLLQTRYGYSRGVLTTEQLLQLLINHLKNSDGHVEGLEASLILLAKRIGWDTAYRQLVCRSLMPLINEWRACAVSDLTIREAIIVMGYVTRCFPVVEAKACVQAVLNLLGTVLLQQNISMEVQEAAACSLLRLSRHNFFYVSNVLVKWQPSSSSVSDSLLAEMLTLFQFRNPKWWHTFLRRKRVCT